MKKQMTLVLGVMLMAGLCGMVVAGSMDSPGLPLAGSGMYSIEQTYDYLNSGTVAPTPGPFQEPSGPPGPTMKTMRELYDDMKAKFDECPVAAADVRSGVKFFCTQPGIWGVQTGTAYICPTVTPTPTITPTPTWGQARCASKGGYWGATQLAAPDDHGCWFCGAIEGQNCSTVCQAQGLTCDPRNWNDDTACTVGRHLPCWDGGGGGCQDWSGSSGPPAWRYGGYNSYRHAGYVQDCDLADTMSPDWPRLCVCR